MTEISSEDLLIYTTEIVSALVARQRIDNAHLPDLIMSVSETLGNLGRGSGEQDNAPIPAVPIAQSIQPDHLICLEDGRKMKMLKRHLKTQYGLSPEDYRARWNLPKDYPMVAPEYAVLRRELALKSGLGGRGTTTPAAKSEQAQAEPAPAAPQAPTAPAAPSVEAPPARRRLKPVFRASEESSPAAREEAIESPASRRVLSARPRALAPQSASGAGDVSGDAGLQALICQAIAKKTCIRAIYNKKVVILAPYILFLRNDESFMRAVTLEHDGRKPRELKLGTFKLLGLGQTMPTTRRFVQQFEFDPADPQYVGKTICALDSGNSAQA